MRDSAEVCQSSLFLVSYAVRRVEAHVLSLRVPGHGTPLHGGRPEYNKSELHLGTIALRGERGVLQIPASDMLRLRWNPFYPYVESRVLEFLGLEGA